MELAEEPPQALRAAAAPQAAAAVRNERREIFFISVSSFRAVCVSYGGVPRAWEPLAFVDTRIPHRRKKRNGKILELLQFFCVFLKKMHFLTLGSALSCFLAQFTFSPKEKSV